MDFGVVLQTDPPASRVIELAKRAETYGFSHAWTFDSHLLWEEPFVIYSRILNETHKLIVGPMVTNPATRDWTVTASLFATLNEMYGNRTVCGIGRGDSAVRVINGKPVNLSVLRESIGVIRGLANGEAVSYKASTLRLPWNAGQPPRGLGGRLRTQGARARRRGGRRVHPAARRPRHHGVVDRRGAHAAAEAAGRDPDVDHDLRGRAGLRHRRQRRRLAHGRDQCRWFGGMVGNHVADIVARYGGDGAAVPEALTDYITGREGYDYNEHGQAGNTHTDFVPDEIVDRFCLIGPPEAHVLACRSCADLGVDQFALYLQHDDKDGTLRSYGEHVIPAVNQREAAKV